MNQQRYGGQHQREASQDAERGHKQGSSAAVHASMVAAQARTIERADDAAGAPASEATLEYWQAQRTGMNSITAN